MSNEGKGENVLNLAQVRHNRTRTDIANELPRTIAEFLGIPTEHDTEIRNVPRLTAGELEKRIEAKLPWALQDTTFNRDLADSFRAHWRLDEETIGALHYYLEVEFAKHALAPNTIVALAEAYQTKKKSKDGAD